jgi:hypothetical protein
VKFGKVNRENLQLFVQSLLTQNSKQIIMRNGCLAAFYKLIRQAVPSDDSSLAKLFLLAIFI